MRATEIRDYFRDKATWVEWDGRTVDRFAYGNENVTVKGIAVGWTLTLEMARQAAKAGANLFITHESIFYSGYRSEPAEPAQVERDRQRKARELDRLKLTVLRCRDTWDRFPSVGIPDTWIRFLGFEDYRRAPQSFYARAKLPSTTAATLAKRILKKVAPLGQQYVEVFNPAVKVSSLCVGTGSITELPLMREEAKADCYLVTNDGSRTSTTELHATDLKIPLIRVDHATSELPGMMALADHLSEAFPGVPVKYIPYPCPYKLIAGGK